MPSVEQLQKEVKRLQEEKERKEMRLRNFQRSRVEIDRIGKQRKALTREIKQLKNPKSTAFKKNLTKKLIKGSKKTLKVLGRIAESVTEEDKPKRKTKRKSQKHSSIADNIIREFG